MIKLFVLFNFFFPQHNKCCTYLNPFLDKGLDNVCRAHASSGKIESTYVLEVDGEKLEFSCV